ncbi:MAG: hypothetical protein Q9209_002814 [Squamulea sp. 1 TL-2023]
MNDNAMNIKTSVDEISRPFKRRKYYRKRAGSPQSDQAVLPETQYSSDIIPKLPSMSKTLAKSPDDPYLSLGEDDSTPISVAEILRQRRTIQKKRAGIEFSNTPTVPDSSLIEAITGDGILDKDDTLDKILTVVDRFAPQTGQVADVDKHMYATPDSTALSARAHANGVRMAYIDSELAKRRPSQGKPMTAFNGSHSDDDMVDGVSADLAKHRQPAALGKLHEIDLGADATLKNIARTEAAKRRLEGEEPEVEEATGKVRLRRDGKPWRGKRRRNSDDVKRDRLVEEVMKESRRKVRASIILYHLANVATVEIYDEPEEEQPHDDQAADDRIAEQFRREFMDAISSRRQKAAQSAKKGPGTKVDDKPKGPKLGGSRSARAAMREQQEKAEKATKR